MTDLKPTQVLPARRIRSLIKAALPPDIRPPDLRLEALRAGHDSLVLSLPPWVARFGLLAGEGRCLLWCEPGPAQIDAFPSQMALDLAGRRMMIDILDAATRTWVSRESAEAGPLVAGLPYTGHPLLAWIRPV
jgi:hypothetical protein